MKVGDLVKHEWKGGGWIGVIIAIDGDEAILFRPELSKKILRWPKDFQLEVISESR